MSLQFGTSEGVGITVPFPRAPKIVDKMKEKLVFRTLKSGKCQYYLAHWSVRVSGPVPRIFGRQAKTALSKLEGVLLIWGGVY